VRVKSFLHAIDHEQVVAAIREAESRSTGEVRVHVSRQAVDEPEKAAAAQFEALGMTATRERNGVLIFIAPTSQKFAIIGDAGIHEKCGPGFWAEVAQAMSAEFRAGHFTDGIVKGVARAGDVLARHFPRSDAHTDVNELPDQVTED
jgi:uncharacterized membrane protein